MHKLSTRLRAVAERVLPGRPAADIGTDHGGLACALVSEGRSPRVIAIDVAQAPLKRAEAAVRGAGLAGQVEVRLGDGLGPLASGEVATVVIVGMGGETIVRILKEGEAKLVDVDRLVLSPHTVAPMMRRHLVSRGWLDVDACMVSDRGHWYPVTAWERGASDWSEEDFEWGRALRARADPLLASQLTQERARMAAAHTAARAGRGPSDPEVRAIADALAALDRELQRLA